MSKALNRYYLDRYGITWQQYREQFKKQNGRCAICGKHQRHFKRRLAQDHNHRTKQTRGLLCYPCNYWKVNKHTVETAKSVYDYLLLWEKL